MADRPDFSDTIRITIPAEVRRLFEESGAYAETSTPSAGDTQPLPRADYTTRSNVYEELLKGIYDGVLITDTKGRVRDANLRAAHLLGYSRDMFAHLSVGDIIDNAPDALMAEILDCTEHDAFVLIQAHCIRRDGTDFPAEVVTHRMTVDGHLRFCLFIRDISERIRLEKDLLRLSRAVESSSDAVTILDSNGNHVYQNPAFRSLFGARANDVSGNRGFDKLFDDTGQSAFMKHQLQETGTWQGEIRIARDHDHVIQALFRADAIRDDSDEHIGTVAVLSDITAQKQAQEKLEEALAALARSNEDLEQLAYVASHDLKQPLRAIAGYLGFLETSLGDDANPKTKALIRRAADSAEQLRQLVDSLLEYSRLGNRVDILKDVSGDQVLSQALKNLGPLIEEHGVEIAAEPLPPVRTNPIRLIQVFQNLISNAVKFCDKSTPRVTVTAQTRGAEVIFSISDNGIGIQHDYQDRVFALLQRLHTAEEYPGFGIGLASCRKIVTQWGGDIWVESSEPGVGTTFAFSCPGVPPAPGATV